MNFPTNFAYYLHIARHSHSDSGNHSRSRWTIFNCVVLCASYNPREGLRTFFFVYASEHAQYALYFPCFCLQSHHRIDLAHVLQAGQVTHEIYRALEDQFTAIGRPCSRQVQPLFSSNECICHNHTTHIAQRTRSVMAALPGKRCRTGRLEGSRNDQLEILLPPLDAPPCDLPNASLHFMIGDVVAWFCENLACSAPGFI